MSQDIPPEYELAAEICRLIARRTIENGTALTALAIVIGQTIATEALPGGHDQVLSTTVKAIRQEMLDRRHVESLRRAGLDGLVTSRRIEL